MITQPPGDLAAVRGLREAPVDILGPEAWGLLLGILVVVLLCYTRGASGRRGPGRGRAAATSRRRRMVGTAITVLALAVAAAPAVLAAVAVAVTS
jgi:hypothetical protein